MYFLSHNLCGTKPLSIWAHFSLPGWSKNPKTSVDIHIKCIVTFSSLKATSHCKTQSHLNHELCFDTNFPLCPMERDSATAHSVRLLWCLWWVQQPCSLPEHMQVSPLSTSTSPCLLRTAPSVLMCTVQSRSSNASSVSEDFSFKTWLVIVYLTKGGDLRVTIRYS